ncbi:MAG: hypothetical protein AAFN81_04575 [Bacteroidota bacterium]
MQSVIQIIIDQLQKEHDYLEKQINSCSKEWDFEGAEAFRKPFYTVSKKLRILKNLDNPNFNRISFLKETLNRIDKLKAEQPPSEFFIEVMKSKIPDFEAELAALESTPRKFETDDDTLLHCFDKICSGTIIVFTLEIAQKDIQLEVEYLSGKLQLILSHFDGASLTHWIGKMGFKRLKQIGFHMESDYVAVHTINGFNQEKILSTVELIPRVVYDVFELYGNQGAIIRYNETDSILSDLNH